MDMMQTTVKTVHLGRCGEAILHLDSDRKHLFVELETAPMGLDKSSLNGLISALARIRDEMYR